MNTSSDKFDSDRSLSQSETLNRDRIYKFRHPMPQKIEPRAAKEFTPACDYECSTLFKSFKPLTKFDTVQIFRLLAIKITWWKTNSKENKSISYNKSCLKSIRRKAEEKENLHKYQVNWKFLKHWFFKYHGHGYRVLLLLSSPCKCIKFYYPQFLDKWRNNFTKC